MSTTGVVYAKFREANPITDASAYPSDNWLWGMTKAVLHTAVKVVCSAKLILNGGDALQSAKPEPLGYLDRLLGRLRVFPECIFTSYFPTFMIGRYLIFDDPVVNAALFEHHRGSLTGEGLFTMGKSAGSLLDIIKEIFPDAEIQPDDMMLTCSEGFTREFRNFVHQLIGPNFVKQYSEIIKKEATNSLDRWIDQCLKGKLLDLSTMGQYPSRVLTRLLFNSCEGSDEISETLNTINWFALHRLVGFLVTDADRARYQSALEVFRCTIERLVRNKDSIFTTKQDVPFTDATQKAMATILFFAGQETTGFLVATILLYLAQNPEEQDNIRRELHIDLDKGKALLSKVINVVLSKYPPAFMVGRRGKSDKTLCLEYQIKDEPLRKLIIPPDTGLSAGISRTAEKIARLAPEQLSKPTGYQAWSAFGMGPHTCPGRYLAMSEVDEFIVQTLLRCQINTNELEEPQVVGRVTMQFARPYHVTLDELPSYAASSGASSSFT